MIFDSIYVTNSKQVSDNEFQKVNWKKNKVSFSVNMWDTMTIDILTWVNENIHGKWHAKENYTNKPAGSPITNGSFSTSVYVIIFWFELKEEATLFKLRWQ